jgi:hypothetical protein
MIDYDVCAYHMEINPCSSSTEYQSIIGEADAGNQSRMRHDTIGRRHCALPVPSTARLPRLWCCRSGWTASTYDD